MGYSIYCKIRTPSYTGFGYINVPSFDAPYVNYAYMTDTWSQCLATAGDMTFDLICPSFDWSPTPLGLARIDNAKIKYNNHGQIGDVYEYEIIAGDNKKRILRNTVTSIEPNGHWMGLTTEFIVDEDVIFTVDTPAAFGKDTAPYGGSQFLERTYFSTFPWLGKIDGQYYILANSGVAIAIYDNLTNDFVEYKFSFSGTINPLPAGDEPDEVIDEWLAGYIPINTDYGDPDNPYWGGGSTTSGGGGGNFSDDSDYPTTDSLPSISAVGTGMCTIFRPSLSQLRHLSDVMWNRTFFDFMQNLVENISDMFISLAMVPFNVTAGATVSVTWLGFDTAVSLTLAANQFYEFDMGTIDMSNDGRIFTSGSALDYSPFSQLGIYLPFIGYRELDIDECREAAINLRYRIDILSGSCVAIIRVAGKDIYEFTGNCLAQIPITNENMQSLVSDAVNVGIAVVNTQAAAGAAGADAAAADSAKSAEVADAKRAHANAHLTQSRSQLASATANAAMGMKPAFAKSGSVSGADSMLAVKQPYLFLRTPRQAIPNNYQKYCGFPCNMTAPLGDFSGYTVVEDIRLNNLVATSPEVAEIYELLKKGVII